MRFQTEEMRSDSSKALLVRFTFDDVPGEHFDLIAADYTSGAKMIEAATEMAKQALAGQR